DDLLGRVKKIVIPYFTFGAVILIYWYFIERSFRSISQTFGEAALGLLLGEYKLLDFHSHLWFLPCFFVLAVFYNILVNIGGNKAAYIASAVMAVIHIFVPLPDLPWGIDRVFRYIGYYAVGHLLAELKADEFVARSPIAVRLTGAVILIGGNFALAYYDLNGGAMWFVTAFVGIAGLSVISMLLERVKALQNVGRISLVILCIHGPIYRVLCKLISIPLGKSTEELRASAILTLAVTAVTIALCVLAYEILKRLAPWTIGEKKRKEQSAVS
ncbi:MAG: acyltransferase family protein, partial [Oscillospiraceae bacterium]|nr:acyltransferase family protein [Oscillospiraceae bacterium]